MYFSSILSEKKCYELRPLSGSYNLQIKKNKHTKQLTKHY